LCRQKTFGASWYQSARPSSYHPGGVVSSFCDSNVRDINPYISERVLVHMMTVSAAQSDAGKNFLKNRLFDATAIE
jgi:hypothetical protein